MVKTVEKVKATGKILYIGDDSSYFETIQARVRSSYPDKTFEFISIYEPVPDKYLTMFEKAVHIQPQIIYIDFSQNTQTQLKLAQFFKRDNTTSEIVLVGLVDKKELLQECIFAGVTFTHIKCGEYHDVVYDPFRIAFSKFAKSQDFAKAIFRGDPVIAKIYEDFRIGYITAKGIHVESNLKFQKGDLVELTTNLPENIVPSNKFIVAEVDENNLYYDYSYGYDFDFIFVDPPEELVPNADEQLDPKKLAKRKLEVEAEYKNELVITKKKVKKWVQDNMDSNQCKDTKILIVDYEMTSLRTASKPLDQYPFVIRYQRTLSPTLREISMQKPAILIIQMEAEAEEAPSVATNNAAPTPSGSATTKPVATPVKRLKGLELLVEIVKKIKSIEKYSPFLIIYGSQYSSQALQEKLGHAQLLANPVDIQMDQALQFAFAYEKKQKKKLDDAIQAKIKMLRSQNPMKYKSLKTSDFVPERFYIKKTSKLSHICSHRELQILTMNETEMTFSSEYDFNLGVYRISHPLMMAVTLIPYEEGKKNIKNGLKYEYRALMHSLDENEKKKIRIFVNDNFFESINKQRAKEAEDFKKKNQEVLEKQSEEEGDKEGKEGE